MRRFGIVFFIVVFLHLGASEPSSTTTPPNSPSAKTSTSSSVQEKAKSSKTPWIAPSSWGDRLVQMFSKKKKDAVSSGETQKKKKEEAKKTTFEKVPAGEPVAGTVPKATVTAVKPAPKAYSLPMKTTPKPADRAMRPFPTPGVVPASLPPKVTNANYVPRTPKPQVAVPKIRQEIQKIIDLNKQVRTVQSGRTTQLQRIQDQAKIHQKILGEIEGSQEKAVASQSPTKEALLVQEKLRIIHEETQRNVELVTEIKEGTGAQEEQARKIEESVPESGVKAGESQTGAEEAPLVFSTPQEKKPQA